MVWLEQFQKTHGAVRKDEGGLWKYIREVLAMYKDPLTNMLHQELLPRREIDYKI